MHKLKFKYFDTDNYKKVSQKMSENTMDEIFRSAFGTENEPSSNYWKIPTRLYPKEFQEYLDNAQDKYEKQNISTKILDENWSPTELSIVFKMENDDVNKILFLIQKGSVKLETCNFLNDTETRYANQKLFSVSDSEIFFTSIIIPALNTRAGMAMKVWLNWDEIPDSDIPLMLSFEFSSSSPIRNLSSFERNPELFKKKRRIEIKKDNYASLTYEKNMYQYITSTIIEKGISNNFIPFLNFSQCNFTDILEAINQSELSNKNYLLEKFESYASIPGLKFNILVTGSMIDKDKLPNLRTLVQDEEQRLPMWEISSILYQILYTLNIMEQYQIQQGDFHLGNILVEILEKEQIIKVGSEKFLTRYIPKIFDFDHGYCQALGPNPLLKNEFLSFHSINEFRKSQDYYQFVCAIQHEHQDARWWKLLKQILPNSNYPFYQTLSDDNDMPSDFQIYLTDEQVGNINTYIQENPFDVKGEYNSQIYLNLNVNLLNSFISLKILPQEQQERIQRVKFIYVAFSPLETSLTILGGYECHPVFDITDEVLFPLSDLFKPYGKMTEIIKLLKVSTI